MNRFAEAYHEGLVKTGRCIVFLISFFIACLPGKIILILFGLGGGLNMDQGLLKTIIFVPDIEWKEATLGYAAFCIIGIIIYVPLAVYLSAKLTNQFNTPIGDLGDLYGKTS